MNNLIYKTIDNKVELDYESNNLFDLEDFINFINWILYTKSATKELQMPISSCNDLNKELSLEKIKVSQDGKNSVRVDFIYKGDKYKENKVSIYCKVNNLDVYTYSTSINHRAEIKSLERAYCYDFMYFFGKYQKIKINFLTEILEKLRKKHTYNYIQCVRIFKECNSMERGLDYIPYIKISLLNPNYDLVLQLEIQEDLLNNAKTSEDLKRAIRFSYRDLSSNLLVYEKTENLLMDLIQAINLYNFNK